MVKKYLAFAWLALVFPPAVFAATWTPQTYMKAVFAAAPEIAQAEQSLRMSRDGYESAVIDKYLPSMTLAANTGLWGYDAYGYGTPHFNRSEIDSSLSLDWNLYNLGKDKLSVEIARLGKDSSEDALFSARQSRALEALNAYYGFLLKKRLLAVARQNEAEQQKQNEVSAGLYKEGLCSRADLLQTETNYKTSQLNLVSAEAAYKKALMAFNVLIAREPYEEQELEDAQSASAEIKTTVEEDMKGSLQSRVEIKSALMDIDSARAQYRKARLDSLVSFKVDFAWEKYGLTFLGLNNSSYSPNPNYSLGASLSVPLGFFRQSQRRDSDYYKAAEEKASHALEAVRREVKTEVAEARINLELAAK